MDILNKYLQEHYDWNFDPNIGDSGLQVLCEDGFSITVKIGERWYSRPAENNAFPYSAVECTGTSACVPQLEAYNIGGYFSRVPIEAMIYLIEAHGGIKDYAEVDVSQLLLLKANDEMVLMDDEPTHAFTIGDEAQFRIEVVSTSEEDNALVRHVCRELRDRWNKYEAKEEPKKKEAKKKPVTEPITPQPNEPVTTRIRLSDIPPSSVWTFESPSGVSAPADYYGSLRTRYEDIVRAAGSVVAASSGPTAPPPPDTAGEVFNSFSNLFDDLFTGDEPNSDITP